MTSTIESDTAQESQPRQPQMRSSLFGKKFTCPFFRKDSCTSHDISRACRGPGWDSIPRLKEHLRRCHMPSKNQCNRCRQGFHDPSELASHQRVLEPCLIQNDPLLVTVTEDQLKRHKTLSKGHSKEGSWILLYQIIFPDDRDVPSPYRKSSCGHCIPHFSSRSLDDYHQYQLKESRTLIQQELAKDFSISAELRTHMTALMISSIEKMRHAYDAKTSAVMDLTDDDVLSSSYQDQDQNEGQEMTTHGITYSPLVPVIPGLVDDWMSGMGVDVVSMETFEFGTEG
ncbi:hypothetical protein F5Y16DRAFT_148442 [Xylariaceae sp. FL0255]|nr:hypothetical protein F5Y16DRAFT_148442 [Xylariaceae sp. FL0255]